MSMLLTQAALAAPLPARTSVYMPFPAWVPSEADHHAADQLAWLNDSPSNELESYPGPGWQADAEPDDAGEPCEPTDAERAAYLAGDTIGESDYQARVALFERWEREAQEQAELDWLFQELHSPYTPTYWGDPGVARLALASDVGHPA